jgi:transcriptional regulator with XRE-family HTH domain
MANQPRTAKPQPAVESGSMSAEELLALYIIAERFPHRQFTPSQLAELSGMGRTMISQIKNESDSPFSGGKCSLRRLDAWLDKHPGFKANGQ